MEGSIVALKEIVLRFNEKEFAMIQAVANRRRSSIRSLLLRLCYELDYADEKNGRKKR